MRAPMFPISPVSNTTEICRIPPPGSAAPTFHAGVTAQRAARLPAS
jgi:hypothetical protein